MAERRTVVLLVYSESAYKNAAHAVGAFEVLVPPRPWIPCTRCEYVNLMTSAHLLGEQATHVFRPTRDVGAISRGNERELHTRASHATALRSSASASS
jgi:hypothetical protein